MKIKKNNGFLGEGRHCSKWVQNDNKDQIMGTEFVFVIHFQMKIRKNNGFFGGGEALFKMGTE